MTAPRFYSWDDDGSPGRALTGNLQNRLKQILVPCLVNGYGSKPGAGWTLEHEHANGFTLSNGDAYVNFVSNLPASAPYPAMNTQAIHIYCAESLTDTSQAIIDGANLCSGPYRSGASEAVNYPRHGFTGIYALQSSLASSQWTLIADERTVIFSISSDISRIPSNTYRAENQITLYFGDVITDIPISNNFVVLGGDNVSYSAASKTYTLCSGFTSLRNLSTGVAEFSNVGADPFLNQSARYVPSPSFIKAPFNINVQSPRISSNGNYVGRLRGVVYDDVVAIHGWDTYLNALGFSGDSFTDRGCIATIGSNQYAYLMAYNGGMIITDDLEFW